MGRFDALTQLEENKTTSAPLREASSTASKKQPPEKIKTQSNDENKPKIMISGNHDTISSTDSFKDKPLKYSTLLDATLIKRIKLFAAEKELKDYEVIEQALQDYFEKHK